jgi:hypothetical protein
VSFLYPDNIGLDRKARVLVESGVGFVGCWEVEK